MTNVVMRPLLRLLSSPQQFSGPNQMCISSVLSSKSGFMPSVQLTNAGHFACISSLACRSNIGNRSEFNPHGSTFRKWFRNAGCASGLKSISHSFSEEQQSSGGVQPVRSAEARCEGFETWKRDGGVVHKSAQVDETVSVEAGAVVHANAHIGPNSHVSSGSVVGPNVVIGSDTRLGFNVSLQNCSIGNSCIIHSGVCVGQDGFGFTINDEGQVIKKPQLLKVQIGDFVEIGANSCIDRGSWRDTVVGEHTKIDNLVQIGHNVVIGRCCLLCGQVGLAGSSTLGDYVIMGGKSGVSDHVSVASKVRVAAKSAVTSHITEPGDYAGFPAVPAKEWRRQMIVLRKLGRRGDSEPA